MEASFSRLLPGLRVLDLCTGMGALCGRLLRDLGMDVVKVEPPEGDPLRAELPFSQSPIEPFEVPRSALNFQGMADDLLSLPSPLGHDTDSILRGVLEYDEATITRWHEDGVLS